MGVVGAALGGAGIAGASGVASSIMTNNSNKDIAQMNNEFNEKMLLKQMDYNTEMYERQLGDTWAFYNDQKAYNTPSAVMQRLNDAGLNGGLIMSGGSSLGSVSGSPTAPSAQGLNVPTATPYSADYSGISQGLTSAVDIFDRMRNSAAQRQNIQASTNNLHIEGQYIAARMVADLAKTKAETKSIKTKMEIDSIIKQFLPQMQNAELSWKHGMTENVQMQTKIAGVEYAMRSQELAMLPTNLKLDVGLKAGQLALLRQQKNLTEKQVEHEAEKIAETIARTYLTNSQQRKTEADVGLTHLQQTGQMQENQFNAETYEFRKRMITETIKKIVSEQKLPMSFGDAFGFGAHRDFQGLE